jgi:DNA-directed RNA polymerase specialized sigma24 family protein
MYQKILSHTKRMVRTDHEDITQEVWIWFTEHPLYCPPSTRMIRFRVWDQLRKRRKHLHLELQPEHPQNETKNPFLDMDVNEVVKRAELNDTEQMILYYKFVLDLNNSQIAREMGMDRVRIGCVVRDIIERMKECVLE